MPDTIRDGSGKGYLAQVNKNNRLFVTAEVESIQHTVSLYNEQAYQVIGIANLASGTVVALHIKNSSTNKDLVVTYLRHQVVGATGGDALPSTSNYFSAGMERIYASGGAIAMPVNMSSGSGNTADVVAYQTDPTVSGTVKEFDRWYTQADADMNTYNKEGALIVPRNGTLELTYVGNQTGGILYTRLSFIMKEVIE